MQLLCLAPVVAPSSTGWQACPAFKDTSIPTVHPRVSTEQALLMGSPSLLFSCPVPSHVLPHLCAHTVSIPKKGLEW